jgi:hypothetical protein
VLLLLLLPMQVVVVLLLQLWAPTVACWMQHPGQAIPCPCLLSL